MATRNLNEMSDEELFRTAYGDNMEQWPDEALLAFTGQSAKPKEQPKFEPYTRVPSDVELSIEGSVPSNRPDATATPNVAEEARKAGFFRTPATMGQAAPPASAQLVQAPEPGRIEQLTGLPIGGRIWNEATQQYEPYGVMHGMAFAAKSGLLSQPYQNIQGSGTILPALSGLIGEGVKYAALSRLGLSIPAASAVSAGARVAQDDTPSSPTGYPKEIDPALELALGMIFPGGSKKLPAPAVDALPQDLRFGTARPMGTPMQVGMPPRMQPEVSPKMQVQMNRGVSEIDPTVPKTEPVVSKPQQLQTSTEVPSQPPVASGKGGGKVAGPKEQAAIANGLHPKTLENINKGMESFDSAILGRWLHPDNKMSRSIFEERTGLKLPKTVSGTKEFLLDWEMKNNPETRNQVLENIKSQRPDLYEAAKSKYDPTPPSPVGETPVASVKGGGKMRLYRTGTIGNEQPGTFFSEHPAVATAYQTGSKNRSSVKAYDVTLSKPLVVEGGQMEAAKMLGVEIKPTDTYAQMDAKIKPAAQNAGYDGIIYSGGPSRPAGPFIGPKAQGVREVVAFDKNAIRDAGEAPAQEWYRANNSPERVAVIERGDKYVRVVDPINQNVRDINLDYFERNFKSESPTPPSPVGKAKEGGITLQSGVNPAEIPTMAQDFWDRTKKAFQNFTDINKNPSGRRLVNIFGTPEIVLRGRGIVEPFEKAKLAIEAKRGDLQKRLEKVFEGIEVNSEVDRQMFKQLDNPNAVLTPREQEVRAIFDELLDLINEHRVARGQNPVNRREGYITHLADYAKEQSATFRDIKIPSQLKFAFEKRGAEGFGYKQSAKGAVETYVDAALKDAFYGDALAEAVPKLEKLNRYGDKPVVVTKTVTDATGGTKEFHFYNLGDAPLFSERKYAEEFIKRQLGWPTFGEKAIQGIFPSLTPNAQRTASQAVTKMFYSGLLGGAIDTGVKNLTQGINTVAELGYMPTLRGYAKLFTKGGVAQARGEHLLEEFQPLFAGGDRSLTKGAFKAFDDVVLGGPMKFSEFVNRGMTYHAAMDEALRAGKSVEEAHSIARATVRKTQFAYGKLDTSPFLQSAVTRPLFQFTSYPIKQSELIWQWATTKGERGKLLRYMATTGALITGGTYAGIDLSGVFMNPLKMVDPDSKEGFTLPGSDKRVSFSLDKLAQSGFVPQGPAPLISAPKSIIGGALSDDPYKQEQAKRDAISMFIPGGRYARKVYQAYNEIMGEAPTDARGRKIADPSIKNAILKLTGLRPTDAEVDRSTRESVIEVEDYYKNTRRAFLDATIAGDMDKANKIIDELANEHPELLIYLVENLETAIEDEAVNKQQTSQERFFDSKLRKLIYGAMKR